MNKLTTKSTIFAALIATSVMASTAAKADEFVSLETAVEMLVSQQGRMVFNQVSQQIANSIEQEVANFQINSLFTSDKGVPSVSVSEISSTSTFNEEDDSSDLPK